MVQGGGLSAILLANDSYLGMRSQLAGDGAGRVVFGTIVDDDDVKRLVSVCEDGTDGPGNDLRLVEGGDHDGNRRPEAVIEWRTALGLVDVHQGQRDAEKDAQRAEDDGRHECRTQEQIAEIDELEHDAVAGQHQRVGLRDGRHDLIAGHSHDLRDGDELVPLLGELTHDDRNQLDRLRPVAARIVEQDHAPLLRDELGTEERHHVLGGAVVDRAVRLTLRQVPILRIDELQYGDVVEARGIDQRPHLFGARWLGVSVVGRAKQECGTTEDGLEDALRGIHLQLRALFAEGSDVRVREGVIPDLVSFGEDSFHQPRIALGVLPYEKERSLHVQPIELIEDLRRIEGGWPVVDGQRDPFLMKATPPDHVRVREDVI